jgi:hypothetical protein
MAHRLSPDIADAMPVSVTSPSGLRQGTAPSIPTRSGWRRLNQTARQQKKHYLSKHIVQATWDWRSEFRIYRWDKNGKVVKSDDHLMDASRYLMMSGLEIAQTKPGNEQPDYDAQYSDQTRSSVTGY